jgi:predicted TIM-barrel fold metal-dependent hydrolase
MELTSPGEWLSQLGVSKVGPIVDGHVHMGPLREEPGLLANREATGTDRMALVSIQNPSEGAGLPQSLCMKSERPNRFYVFAGLNHGTRLSGGRAQAPGLVEQVNDFVACGCNGLKMIEGKPTARQEMNVPVTDAYFRDYWARVEELALPIIWHVNDPEEFWDPERIPRWAAERKWGYGPDDVQKEPLYAEVDEVLRKHPQLKIIFAHFYFLSADLPRAARFFDKNPSVLFDLAPGIEMLYNISRDPDAGRAFFVKYADRIVYGTDLFSGLTPPQARARAGIVLRWLGTEDRFRVPSEADFLLGPPEDGEIRGLGLPPDALKRILRENFERLAGPRPKPLDIGKAVEVCEWIGHTAEAMSGKARSDTQAGKVAQRLKERL